jgi:hypothetical protein
VLERSPSRAGRCLFAGTGTLSFSNGLDFDSAEGVLTTNSTVNASGNLTGSGGFTKAGQAMNPSAGAPGIGQDPPVGDGRISVGDVIANAKP